MINERELRIGNWINYVGGISPEYSPPIGCFQVESIDDSGNVNTEDGQYPEDGQTAIWIGFCDPITLTPDILQKCGFIMIADAYVLTIHEWVKLLWHIESNHFCLVGNDYTVVHNFDFKIHLHQLQNLFYSLTGEELQYKP